MAPVFIVDAFSQIFRWYHAMPSSFTAPDGMPVNTLFGMGKFLFQLHKTFDIGGGIFAYDRGGSVLRRAIHPEYKSNRPPMPEDLACQMPAIAELIDAFGWTRLDSEGYEADDIIATLVSGYPEQHFRIITSDKDIAQLVDDSRVKILSPLKQNAGWQEMTPSVVFEKFGVPPHLIPDYLALVGDSIDVVGGVPGIGPKTAAQLIQSAGSVAEMLAHPEKIANEKWRAKIVDHSDLLQRNLALIYLNKSVPNLPTDASAWSQCPSPDYARLRALFSRYALKSLLKEVDAVSPESCPAGDNDLFVLPQSSVHASPSQESSESQEFMDDLFANVQITIPKN